MIQKNPSLFNISISSGSGGSKGIGVDNILISGSSGGASGTLSLKIVVFSS